MKTMKKGDPGYTEHLLKMKKRYWEKVSRHKEWLKEYRAMVAKEGKEVIHSNGQEGKEGR